MFRPAAITDGDPRANLVLGTPLKIEKKQEDKPRVAVMIAVNPKLNVQLKDRCRELAEAMVKANPDLDIRLVFDDRPGIGHNDTLPSRAKQNAMLRQAMVDDYLEDADDFVMMVDADLNDYPAELPGELIRRGGGNVAAPLVLHQGYPDKYYDTAGFVENGHRASEFPPYFEQKGPVLELDSVGCIYIVPAQVFRDGAKYEPSDWFTEHFSVCKKAKEQGFKVLGFSDLIAMHAHLPWYGERHH
jgi:hypothetical protein